MGSNYYRADRENKSGGHMLKFSQMERMLSDLSLLTSEIIPTKMFCRGDKSRTGVVVAFILAVAGVERE